MVDCWSVVCARCAKRRSERRDILTELYETELKYGRDLRIVVEEFYRPMLVAGLLSSDQLAGIFLNAEELIQVRHTKQQQCVSRQERKCKKYLKAKAASTGSTTF